MHDNSNLKLQLIEQDKPTKQDRRFQLLIDPMTKAFSAMSLQP
jgi:hypothetical protein